MSSKRRSSKLDTLKISDLSLIVECPSDIDLNEWFAVHIVQFFNELSLLSAVIRKDNVICSEQSCPKMSVHSEYEYLWHSNEFIQPISVSAPKSIDFLLEWIDEIMDDTRSESLSKSLASKICRRIARVYGHFYFAHYQQVAALHLDTCLNTSFQYFLYFVKHHKLVKDKELYPMRRVVRQLYKEEENEDNDSNSKPSS